MNRMLLLVNRLLIVAVGGYVVLVVALYFGQRHLLYLPTLHRVEPAAAGFPEAEEIAITTEDGERLIAWHVPPGDGRPVVIFFHGNADTLSGRAARFKKIAATGIGLVAPAFRGYSGSTGSPDEAGLYRDGEAAYQFAAERYGADRLALWGFSLGSGVAVNIAAAHRIGGLVLEASFTSLVDVARLAFPLIPVGLLLKDRFPSDERIGRITAPLLVVHGTADAVVPVRLGEALFALAPGPKRFVRFPGGGHADLDAHGALAVVLDFLSEGVDARDEPGQEVSRDVRSPSGGRHRP